MSLPSTEFLNTTVQRCFNKAAATYDQAARLPTLIAQRLLQRLQFIRLDPTYILELGAGTGILTQLCVDKFPQATVLALDHSSAMLQQLQRKMSAQIRPILADSYQLAVKSHSVELVIANLLLPWLTDLPSFFAEIRRVLKPGGLFVFSSVGPDTLQELRACWAEVSAYPRVHHFVDLHDIGDFVLAAQLHDPVVDMEYLTLRYSDLDKLYRDLKQQGFINLHSARLRGLQGKMAWQRVRDHYEVYRQQATLPVTVEIIYGHAWQPLQLTESSHQQEVRINVDSIMRVKS